jgi:phospholipid/cholesterol/gamma-HCH transport system substrate-binding protein
MRRAHRGGLSRTTAGLILIVAAILITYFGFTKSIPFRHHFSVKADFSNSNTLRVNSLVRIAGVNVGRVTAIEPIEAGDGRTRGGSRVTMRIEKVGRPIHTDATVSLRPRIFLEGNPFLDIQPGSPTAPILADGETIPQAQTRTPVQFDQLLTALQADTRADLVRLLAELSTGLSGKGGIGYNRAVQYWEPAFRDSAIVNDATLGTAPHDLSRYLRAQGEFFGALDRNPPALKALITDFNKTARAFALEQESLKRTLTELPRTLRAAQPALASLNSSFPPLRRLVADLRPATRSTGPMIDASLPFIAQLRGLVSPPELQGLSSDLRKLTPDLAMLNNRLPGLYHQVGEASSCQNEVIIPWANDKVGDPNFPATGKVYQEGVKGLPGLAGESRSGDANGQWARVLAGNGAFTYGISVAGQVHDDALTNRGLGLTNFPLEGTGPPKSPRPEIRYDKPCETQERPDLDVEPDPPLDLLGLSQIDPTSPLCGPAPAPGPALIAFALTCATNQVGAFLLDFCNDPNPANGITCDPATFTSTSSRSERRQSVSQEELQELAAEWTGLEPDLFKKGK